MDALFDLGDTAVETQAGRMPESQPDDPVDWTWITTTADLAEVVEHTRWSTTGFDVETTGLDPMTDRLRLVQISTDPNHVYIADVYQLDHGIGPLQVMLNDCPDIVGHRLVFDYGFLAANGLTLPPDLGRRTRDTYLGLFLAQAGTGQPNTLEHGARTLLGVNLDKSEQKSRWDYMLTHSQVRYAARDSTTLHPLVQAVQTQVDRLELTDTWHRENRALPMFALMRVAGAPADRGQLEKVTEDAKQARNSAARNLQSIAGSGINWGSPKQVLRYFASEGVELPDTQEGTLKEHQNQHGAIAALLNYRQADKQVTAFGDELLGKINPTTGRVHAEYNQMGSKAGRTSCKNPNLQQIPNSKKYRSGFRTAEGWVLIKADYSQIELRVAADIAPDETLIEAYQAGKDIHTLTASLLLGKPMDEVDPEGERKLAKPVNFGLLYGMGAEKLQAYAVNNYGVPMTLEQAQTYRARFFEAYAGLRAWHKRVGASDEPITTVTTGGRKRFMVDRFTEKLNSPVQGNGSADMTKLALALMHERQGQVPGARPVMTIHDEIVVEAPERYAGDAVEWTRGAMLDGARPFLHRVPAEVEVEVGPTWAG